MTVDALIDTGADRTHVTPEIAEALQLEALGHESVGLASGSGIAMQYRCEVAWTIYDTGWHRFRTALDVLCLERPKEALIGMDFLQRFKLHVDTEHGGLIGWAPEGAQPLTGGGYVINAPPGLVRRINRDRYEAAEPGQVLRPHPAWRFTRPSGTKGPVPPRDRDG